MRIIVPVIFLLFGLISGIYFGFKKAPEEFAYWNSQFNASILAYELESLKNEGSESTLWLKETDLDYELANYGRYMESKYKWVFPLITGLEHDPKYITKAVTYRVENPFNNNSVSTTESWKSPEKPKTKEFINRVIEGEKENKRLLEMVLKTHAAQ